MRGLLATLLAAVGAIAGAGTAVAADDVPWSVSTAANSFGSDRQNYSYTVDPGGEVQDALVVANSGKTPLTLGVYAADGFTTDDGRLDLLTDDAKSTGVGTWVHTPSAQVTIQPGKSLQVPFALAVPAGATPGDHLGGIVTSLKQSGDVDRRLAIRIRVRVSGALEPSVSVDDVKIHYSGTAIPFAKADATVTYTIHNTGNAILAARPSTSLVGLFGAGRVGSMHVDDTPQLLPGESWKVSAKVDGVRPLIRETGTVTLLPLLTDAAGSTGTLDTVTATAHAWSIPWAALLVLVVLCLAVIALVTSRRVRRARTSRPEAA
ncbi:WxL protein peptidoglycan domain-containing protein [Kribbella sp. NPDC058693]|uniref:WxL protein peptidoglycan domain-containing protein n=1 Tax=Kribbella sp. NPDC058693 TaxID=3346602 RepID=UPI00364AD82D